MIDNSNAAAQRAATLPCFPLSRVTEAFHDEMLGALPPGQIVGMPGFFVSDAVTGDIHAQFVRCNGHFYGSYVELGNSATWITHMRIDAFDAAHPNAEELAWYPEERETAA